MEVGVVVNRVRPNPRPAVDFEPLTERSRLVSLVILQRRSVNEYGEIAIRNIRSRVEMNCSNRFQARLLSTAGPIRSFR